MGSHGRGSYFCRHRAFAIHGNQGQRGRPSRRSLLGAWVHVLSFAMGKNQKKKGQTMSLAEFASDTVAADPMALPTAPRESTYALSPP